MADNKKELIKNLKNAISENRPDEIVEVTEEYIENGYDSKDAISKGITPGMREIGEKFDKGDIFLPQVMTLGDAVSESSEKLLSTLSEDSEETKEDKIVIGTIEGDIHDIGKGIVQMMLKVEGFDLVDLGRDVPLDDFIEAAKEHEPDIMGSSALMTTTRSGMEELEDMLEEEGLRSEIKTMIGGAPITEHYAEQIGADAYGEDAMDAVEKAKNLVNKNEG
ncbi:MAG: Trimethylamine corrinoid protein MtbC1 [Candidatus Methanohalarchaeum thermophilum]|uniref:Trimethylamine corrinoid protein MtbC1 n=1 Tax=Methanohalarchaeum thermophilum TaxID=1903181 RepID=A0A1Q6DT58_METT1|nr:MAG: Trimethylamine corrinoid protein MtbC1 [Candidatus Methanohalarchaeum thermophilum]